MSAAQIRQSSERRSACFWPLPLSRASCPPLGLPPWIPCRRCAATEGGTLHGCDPYRPEPPTEPVMGPWSLVVDVVRALVFSAAHLFGGSVGAGVLAVSIVARIALLPVTLRIARKALEHQRRLAALAPEREVLKRRFAKDPLRLAEEVAALHQRHGIGPVPEGMLRNIAIQLPINAALYQR